MAFIKFRLEQMFLKKIIDGLRDDSITVPQAKDYAQEFLSIEPFTSTEDAYNKMNVFVQSHPAFTELKDYIETFEKEKEVNDKIAQMREHIKQNNIDAALQVAKS